ncbi:MAG: B12-binding domain-containing radical SAM protein [Tannerella sp.]|nr:B12-binding domain-containing radical SAM protein [Tannerella sp.]
MIITFIVPPSLDGELPAERTAGCTRLVYPMPNIYELIVVAILEKEHDVRYRDFVLEGENEKQLIRFLADDKSDCYMLWCVNLSLETDLKTIRHIRKSHPEALIIVMGPGVTYYTAKLLTDERVAVVRGEPELAVRELIETVSGGGNPGLIKGISFLKDGRVHHNPARELIRDLDSLPFPARHFIEKYPFTNPKLKIHPYTTVLTSRNCPYKCIYCVPSSLTFAREIEFKKEHGRKPPVAYRSVENIVEELDLLAAKGYRAITFIDDNFITTTKRLRPVCECLKRHGFSWGCQARADAITEEVARMLHDSDCGFVDLGVESFNDDILRYIKKGLTSEHIYEGIKWLMKYEIPVKLNILIGTSPLETKATIKDTLRKARALKVSQVMFNIVAPFPGTEFYELARENGWIAGGDYKPTDVQHHSILNYPGLSSREMEKMLFRNNVSFFLRPSFIMKNIGRFGSFTDFKIALKAVRRKLFHK